MTSEAQTQAQADALIPLPTTHAELRQLIAATIDDLFKDPRNARVFATYVAQANAEALRDSMNRLVREQAKPVITKIEYPTSWKAEVTGERNALVVTFSERDEAGEWIEVIAAAPVVESLTRLVLSSTAVPGDILYVTTTGAIDQAYEQATDQIMSAPQQEQQSRGDAAQALERQLQAQQQHAAETRGDQAGDAGASAAEEAQKPADSEAPTLQ